MKKKQNLWMSICLAFLCFVSVESIMAQNAKKEFKEADKAKRSKDYDLAIVKYSKVIELELDNEVAFVYRAFCYEQLNDLEAAATDYMKAFNIRGNEYDLSFHAAQLFFQMEDYVSSMESLDKTLSVFPIHLEALELKASIQIKEMDYENAMNTIDNALKEGRTTHLLYLKGVALSNLGEQEEAAKYFKKVAFKDDEHYQSKVSYAEVLIHQNDLKNAEKELGKAQKINPEYAPFYKVRANYYEAILDKTAALNDYETYIKMYPDDYEVQFKTAKIFTETPDYKKAIFYYSAILENNPDEFNARYERAKCYQNLNKIKLAIADYEKLARVEVENQEMKNMVSFAELQLIELNKESYPDALDIKTPKVQEANSAQ